MVYFLLRDYTILPKKELHLSLWVNTPDLQIRLLVPTLKLPYISQHEPQSPGKGTLTPFKGASYKYLE